MRMKCKEREGGKARLVVKNYTQKGKIVNDGRGGRDISSNKDKHISDKQEKR